MHGPADASGKAEKGIVYYPRLQVVRKTTVTAKDCNQTVSIDIVTIADTTRPQLLWYDPGLLETYKFSPTLAADGTLLSLTSESTPDKGETFKNIAAGVGSIASTAIGFHGLAATPPVTPRTCPAGTLITVKKFDPNDLPTVWEPQK